MANYTVTIKESDGVFVVDPPELHMKPRDTVVFHNATNDPIAMFFPEKGLFSGFRAKYTTKEVLGKLPSDSFTVHGNHPGKRGNRFAYAVFCQTPGGFAVAHSNPIIIIDY